MSDIDISLYKGITSDSRKVEEGFIYVAIKGQNINGEDFIESAINNGASLIITEKNCKNTRLTLSHLAKQFHPNQPSNLVAVTGTSGKTSVAYFYEQIAKHRGFKSACLGTLGFISDEFSIDMSEILTSPDPVQLHSILDTAYTKGITHMAIEASSHGLDQYRLDSVNLNAAAFTNFSQDHLDYHKNFEHYFASKLRLFTDVLKSGVAVLNADIPQITELTSACKNKDILLYGKHYSADLQLIDVSLGYITIKIFGKEYRLQFKPLGEFQAYNLLAAIGLALSSNISASAIIDSIPHICAAAGRMEEVGMYNNATIFIDYAHKPEALEKALMELRKNTKSKLHLIFGCGGNRDTTKRQKMGEIATDLADQVYITDDNPRHEDPAIIRKQILSGCLNTDKIAAEIGNREKCISFAISKLQDGDTLLIAGKGHESYQIIGDSYIEMCDKAIVKNILSYQKS